MNYQKIYDDIINRSIKRKKPDCYCEKHHIVPRSMGGDDDKTNIAVLTAKEHFLAHWLLYKIHRNQSMAHAFWKMTHPVGNGRTRYNSRSYKYAKEANAWATTTFRSGKNHPNYGKVGKDSASYGSKRTDESKNKIREKALSRIERGIIPARRRRVINLDTGSVFLSITDAQKSTSGNVSYAIKSGGTAGGNRFAYIDDDGQPIITPSNLKGYAKGERSPNAKPVIHVETGIIYPSAKEAGESFGMTGAGIIFSIKNGRPTKKGVFQYV